MLSTAAYSLSDMFEDTPGRYAYPSTFSEVTSQPHLPLGTVMLRNADALRQLGLRNPPEQLLGKGAFGAAYEIPLLDRSVLKFTRDPTEVQAATLLLGRQSERIVHIHGLWAIPGTQQPHLRGWYAIHRQYLKPLSKRDAHLVDTIFYVYEEETVDLTLPRRRNHAMRDKWRGYLREALMSGDAVPMDEEGMRVSALGGGKMLQRAMELLSRIGEAVAEMHSAGIDWEDIHSGNLMRNEAGRLVIADVGWGLMHREFKQTIPFLDTKSAQAYLSAPPASAAGS